VFKAGAPPASTFTVDVLKEIRDFAGGLRK
jgi:hypothetical protein